MPRRPTPTRLKLVAGNPGKRKLPKREPKPRRMIPSPPAHLSPEARVAWGEFSVMLDRLGVLTEADRLALERVCETAAEVVELKLDIRKHGRYQRVRTKSGGIMERDRRAVAQLQDADRRLRAWLIEFGLTPAARSKVDADRGREAEDPITKYLGA